MTNDHRNELAALTARVEVLERALERSGRSTAPTTAGPGGLLDEVRQLAAAEGARGAIVYAGSGEFEGGEVEWQITRSWSALLQDNDVLSRVFAALGSGIRLRILTRLLEGPAAGQELQDMLQLPSSGQLYHHLKDLMANALVHQPKRGTFAIPSQRVVPLLTAICAARDLPSSGAIDAAVAGDS